MLFSNVCEEFDWFLREKECDSCENGGYIEAGIACLQQHLLLLPLTARKVETARETVQEAPCRNLPSISGNFIACTLSLY